MRYKPEVEARYTNYFQVGHNSAEVILDCGCFYVEEAGPIIHTRIATTPVYAKALLDTLQDAIRTYERDFGEIRVDRTETVE